MRVGIDTGGTFTDLVGLDTDSGKLFVSKRPSTPTQPEDAVLDVLSHSGIVMENIDLLVLGTTIGINALHQRQGARVIYLTTNGFEDVLFIQRVNRKYHYDLSWQKPDPYVKRQDCVGVAERRMKKDGTVGTVLDESHLQRLKNLLSPRLADSHNRDTAIAVNLLFSYVDADAEIQIRDFLRKHFPNVPVSLSHEVAPIWREYERGSTTIADAFVKPRMVHFIEHLDKGLKDRGLRTNWAIMKSNGGNVLASNAAAQPVQLMLSGLAGGMIAGRYFGQLLDSSNVITLDMGGTSTDVGVTIDGEFGYTTEYQVEWGIPIAAPCIDLTTIGAGGGSLARIDKGGFLRVGPRSAGAVPGPVCYDKGGIQPTVTDANLILGRLNPNYFLGGHMTLNVEKARVSLEALGKELGLDADQTALNIVELANENMANAIRLITVERGIDPREFDLVAFGGAGPAHASELADAMEIRRILIPPHPGLASAFGALLADLRVDKISTQSYRSNDLDIGTIESRFQVLVDMAMADLREEGFHAVPIVRRSISMRYMGQNYEQDVPLPSGPINAQSMDLAFETFHSQHEQFYGYRISGAVVELVHFKVTAIGPATKTELPKVSAQNNQVSKPGITQQVYFKDRGFIKCPIWRRANMGAGMLLQGPAVIEEEDSTTLLHPHQSLTVSPHGVLAITTTEQVSAKH